MAPSRYPGIATAAVLAFLVPYGCGRPPAPPRNLIVVSIDTLRADHLGCYGYDRATSPSIDAVAAEGVVFEDASATSPWTKPSHASLLTGLYPRRNGATSMESVLSADAVHLASWLGNHDFQTAAVVNSQWLTSHGLERGFADFEVVDYVQGRREGSPVTDAAIRWLKGRDPDRRFFLLVHYMDVHSDYASLPEYERLFVEPYDGPFTGATQQLYRVAEGRMRADPRDVRHLQNLYDAGVRQVDDRLGELFSYLREQGLLDDSLLVITADHGEEFLEHGGVIHGLTQFQEVIRIPLVFHGPGIPAGARVAEPASLVDLVPTCLALLNVPVPDDLDGVSLQGSWRDPAAEIGDRLLYFEADITFPPPGPGPAPPGPHRAVRNARFKLHYRTDTRQSLLFDLENDPGEQHDASARYPELAASLKEQLLTWLEGGTEASTRTLTEEQLERLRSLGYVGE